MSQKFLKNKPVIALLISFLTTLIVSIFAFTTLFHTWHLKIADTLYTNNKSSEEIVIIGIDEKSTYPLPEGLGQFSKWSRENYVDLLEVLGDDPKVIVFDILFDTQTQEIPIEDIRELKYDTANNVTTKEKHELYEKFIDANSTILDNSIDKKFAEKLYETENVVLAFSSNYGNPIFPLNKFSLEAELGDWFAEVDDDGILRKVPPFYYYQEEDKYYPDMAVAAVKEYLGAEEIAENDIIDDLFVIKSDVREIEIPIEDGKMYVSFFEDPGYPIISFVDVLNGNFEESLFKDKIVLIGVSELRSIQDKVLTPLSFIKVMPGVEFRANEIQTILEEKFLSNQGKFSQILTITFLAIGLALAISCLGAILSTILAVLAIIGYYFSGHLFFRQGLILNMVYPFMAIILTYLASWIYKYFIADKKKREIKSAFSHYVSEKLVDEISKNPDMVKLGGEKRVVTVFFSDIKNSTQISEKTEITSWVSQINEYFTVMESVIKKFGGTIDKYEGDAIMGFWNAPITQEDHVVLGYTAALEMKKALKSLHQKWEQEGKALLEFRIGINTGEAIVGNFGSVSRFDYTVMGNTVNTASRLENSANKTYGTSIIVAGFEDFAAPENLAKVIMRELDTVLLPGKNEPVKLFELVCLAEEITPEIKNLLRIYSSGLAAYRIKDFASAIQSFQSLPDDLPSQVMLKRCKELQEGSVLSGLDENMIFKILNK